MNEKEPILFAATKAFINYNEKILILRESSKYSDGANRGKFDIVGGRIKPRQHFKESLIREIQEETGLKVEIGKPFHVDEWRPIVKGEQWHIVATFFECKTNSNQVKLSEDHDAFEWINPKDCKNYNLIPNLINAFEAYLNK